MSQAHQSLVISGTFTNRHLQIIKMVVRETLGPTEIASRLNITMGTANNHLMVIYRQLGIEGPNKLAKLAKWGADNGYGDERR